MDSCVGTGWFEIATHRSHLLIHSSDSQSALSGSPTRTLRSLAVLCTVHRSACHFKHLVESVIADTIWRGDLVFRPPCMRKRQHQQYLGYKRYCISIRTKRTAVSKSSYIAPSRERIVTVLRSHTGSPNRDRRRPLRHDPSGSRHSQTTGRSPHVPRALITWPATMVVAQPPTGL